MDPINYRLDYQNPFQIATGGMQAGLNAINGINAVRDRDALIAQQKKAQEEAVLQKEQMKQLIAEHAANPTYNTSLRIAAIFPKDQAEAIGKATQAWSDEKKTNTAGQMIGIQTALTKNPEIGMKLLNDYYEALKNSGDEGQAQYIDMVRKTAEQNPNLASSMLIGPAASIVGVDKYSQFSKGLSESATEEQKRPYVVSAAESDALIKKAEARNTPQALALKNRYTEKQTQDLDSQIIDRSNRFGLDQDKLRTDVEMKLYELGQKGSSLNLDAPAKTLINDSAIASASAEQSANQIDDLAAKIEKAGGGYGGATSAFEWLKKATGNQDYMTQLRQEYTRVRNNQAIKMLPAGAASDKDIAMAMQGFPPDNADSATMAQFLKGMAKLNRYTAISENAKSEWVNAVGHLGKPKTDIEIDGIQVPAGMNFPKFAAQYVTAKIGQKTQQAAQSELPNRSYMVHATGAQ